MLLPPAALEICVAVRLSLQARLFLLTAVAIVPALGILVYNEVSLRSAREAEVYLWNC